MGRERARFGYLEGVGAAKSEKKRRAKKAKKGEKGEPLPPAPPGEPATDLSRARDRAAGERVSVVYVRRETVQAVWREVKRDGGESLSELVEDLLLAWLRGRTR